jgi:hypothetical protein
MIGDSAEADGGAERVGIPTAFVDHLPSYARPGSLLSTLDHYGLPGGPREGYGDGVTG